VSQAGGCSRRATAVASSAGKNDSIDSSATVISTAVPKVAMVLKKRVTREVGAPRDCVRIRTKARRALQYTTHE
jgi:hypothetical protein